MPMKREKNGIKVIKKIKIIIDWIVLDILTGIKLITDTIYRLLTINSS